MCFHALNVKGVNKHSISSTFTPCGKCEECRKMERSAWEFRFRAEADEFVFHHGWQMGFITLTYNDQQLPYLPPHAFKDFDPLTCSSPRWRYVPCFNKDHIRSLVHGLRKYLHKKYGCKRLIYICCSEFGSSTKRPHYHCCFVFPPEVPALEFYQCIRDLWCGESVFISQPCKLKGKTRFLDSSRARVNRGFVCPREFGGFGREKPFIVSKPDSIACAKYASKYVCKDIYYLESLPYDDLNFDNPLIDNRMDEYEDFSFDSLPHIRNYMPFHFQTRSLGLGIIQGKSNSELLEIFKKGYHFTGDGEKFQCIPLYIKNKILFSPYYVFENGKRLVRRQASEFFNENYKEVFQKKVSFYEELFKKLSTSDYFTACGRSRLEASEWSEQVRKILDNFKSPLELASLYVNYYGVPRKYSYVVESAPALVYLNHYFPINGFEDSGLPVLSLDSYNDIQNACGNILGYLKFTNIREKTIDERQIDLVRDYWSSQPESDFESCGFISDPQLNEAELWDLE